MAEFAMVEELASLVKDNLQCKHLILSIEEILVNLLQDNSGTSSVLELQPMSPYHRLLLHRLADIFGFAHESVGEGDERHLVLQKCLDSSIPSVLVSDILLQYDEYPSPIASTQILRRDVLPDLKLEEASISRVMPVEDRKAAYLAARQRIFSLHDDDRVELIAPKPRNDPAVARRMIAHALGQRICPTSHSSEGSHHDPEASEEPRMTKKFGVHSDSADISTENKKHPSSWTLETCRRDKNGSMLLESRENGKKGCHFRSSGSESMVETRAVRNSPGKCSMVQSGSNGRHVDGQNLEKEHLGAAKRMFAHALRLPVAKNYQSG